MGTRRHHTRLGDGAAGRRRVAAPSLRRCRIAPGVTDPRSTALGARALPDGWRATASGLIVPEGHHPHPVEPRLRLGRTMIVGVLYAMAFFAASCAGLALGQAIVGTVVLTSGYDALASRGLLPHVPGPFSARVAPAT